MTHALPTAVSLCLLALLACGARAADAPKPLKPLDSWNGKPGDAALKAAAPESGVVADADAWKKLWAAWRPGEELPKVDFQKDLILIATADGPNRVNLSATLDDAGNVRVLGMATRMAGPGFGYAMGRFPRDGIKSVDGKPVPPPAAAAAAPGAKPRDPEFAAKPLAEYTAAFAEGKVTVTARGTNNSGGWTNALEPIGRKEGPPAFTFTQKRPDGVATQALEDFKVTARADAETKPDHVIVTDTAGRHTVPVK